MSEAGEGFLARWSRRKTGLASAETKAEQSAPSASAQLVPTPPAAVAPAEPAAPAAPASEDVAAPPLPTLADVAALTRESDYTRFMLPGVDNSVRNAAMKKLFSDPHFNVMDGLDTYIDDYGKPDPLPLSMLRRMHQSEVLGLFRDEVAEVPAAASPPAREDNACPDGAPPAAVAQSSPSEPPPEDPRARAENDPDLRLQPDDDDRRAGAGPDAGS